MSWAVVAALVLSTIACWFLLSQFVATVTWMGSGSMAPTLRADATSSDAVLVDRLTFRFRAPLRGEIVFFRLDDGTLVLKRVVGMPGETVEIRKGQVLVDGRPLTAPPFDRIGYDNSGHLEAGKRVSIKTGYYFVLGDDSSDSWDSRYWGCLEAGDIKGFARAVIWPPSHVRWFSIP